MKVRFNTRKDKTIWEIKFINKFRSLQKCKEMNQERKSKKEKKSVCIDPDSVIGKEIMYQTALLHEILDEIRGGKTSP